MQAFYCANSVRPCLDEALTIKGTEDEPGAQIDLLIDRRDHVIDLCEIKHSENEYTIDKECDLSLRTKREVFRKHTGTKKTIQIILISTYGLTQNKYSSLISGEVTLNDLFMN